MLEHISTHVLDTSAGIPARQLKVILNHQREEGVWEQLAVARTNEDGRVKEWQVEKNIGPGVYQLVFNTGSYYSERGITTLYPTVQIEFEVKDDTHYHVPLLLGPFGFTTYRGI